MTAPNVPVARSWAVIDRPYNSDASRLFFSMSAHSKFLEIRRSALEDRVRLSVEQFREVERENAVLESAGYHDFFVFRNHSNPGVLSSSRDLLNRYSPAWGNVPVIVDAPDGPTIHGVG